MLKIRFLIAKAIRFSFAVSLKQTSGIVRNDQATLSNRIKQYCVLLANNLFLKSHTITSSDSMTVLNIV